MAGSYKLFYSPGTCAMAVHAVLLAVGENPELVKLGKGENHTAEYLKISPMGQVPALLEDGKVLRESAAIMLHLLDKNKHELMPQNGDARTKALQWLFFFNSTMHQTYGAYFLLSKNLKPEEIAASTDLIIRRINKLWRYVEKELATEFIAGDKPTAADVLLAVIANWLPQVTLGPKVLNICGKVVKLPYFAKALEVESVQYKLA